MIGRDNAVVGAIFACTLLFFLIIIDRNGTFSGSKFGKPREAEKFHMPRSWMGVLSEGEGELADNIEEDMMNKTFRVKNDERFPSHVAAKATRFLLTPKVLDELMTYSSSKFTRCLEEENFCIDVFISRSNLGRMDRTVVPSLRQGKEETQMGPPVTLTDLIDLSHFEQYIFPGGKFLDRQCGKYGASTYYLNLGWGVDATCTTSNPVTKDQLMVHHKSLGLTMDNLRYFSAAKFPPSGSSEKFDVIRCHETIHREQDIEGYFDKVFTLLSPTGIVYVNWFPLWGGPLGHGITSQTLSGVYDSLGIPLDFTWDYDKDGSLVVNWSHLWTTDKKFFKDLEAKGNFSLPVMTKLKEVVLQSNKLSTSDILNILKKFDADRVAQVLPDQFYMVTDSKAVASASKYVDRKYQSDVGLMGVRVIVAPKAAVQ